MATSNRLVWDQNGSRTYETGTDHGVLYPMNAAGTGYDEGIAWNGLTAVTESPSGAEETALWADNIKYLSIRSAEEFGGTIEAYTYPDEFAECDGSKEITDGVIIGQQTRRKFGFSYRTLVGNDTKNNDYGEKIHVIYGCSVTPSERAYSTVNDSPEAITFSWEFTTIPEKATIQAKGDTAAKTYATSVVTIDLTGVAEAKKEAIYNKLWGGDDKATLPSLGDLLSFLKTTLGTN